MKCLHCQDWNGGDPIPPCVVKGGSCCGYENGCQCRPCLTRDAAERKQRNGITLSPLEVIMLSEHARG